MATIGLAMIVRDEADLIERCLDSVKPFVDFVMIEDTGSTDETIKVVRRWLAHKKVEGVVYSKPWVNFGFNRSHVIDGLRMCRWLDYALTIDADDQLQIACSNVGAYKQTLNADCYAVPVDLNGFQFNRRQMCKLDKPFYYGGIVHETLLCREPYSSQVATGISIVAGMEGYRSRNPNKYLDDAATLQQALETETDPFLIARYQEFHAKSLLWHERTKGNVDASPT